MTQINNKAEHSLTQLVNAAIDALSQLGVPCADLTSRRQVKMAKAFLAVAGLKPGMKWAEAKDVESGHSLRSREVIAFMNTFLGENIADSSYDDIRRKDLIFPVEAQLVLKSAKNINANTNDGTRGFALDPVAAKVLRLFGSPQWDKACSEFLADRIPLSIQLQRKRGLERIAVTLGNGMLLDFSAGGHNLLQKKIIEEFLPCFGFGAEVLYVGDSVKKQLYLDENTLKQLSFFELSHDKLPDVVAYSKNKNWLYLIEAVYTSNPITEMRRRALLASLGGCTAGLVLVTAFLDRETYRRHAKDIAWETEVWIADAPEHMIHLNGNKFLGPYH
jgi:type II restriction enzyme